MHSRYLTVLIFNHESNLSGNILVRLLLFRLLPFCLLHFRLLVFRLLNIYTFICSIVIKF